MKNESKDNINFFRLRSHISLSGNGFNTKNRKEYLPKEERYQNL